MCVILAAVTIKDRKTHVWQLLQQIMHVAFKQGPLMVLHIQIVQPLKLILSWEYLDNSSNVLRYFAEKLSNFP